MAKYKSGAANHIHRYKKVNLSQDKKNPYYVFKCVKPACSHYVPVVLAEGAMAECTRCHNPMMIGKLQLNGSSGKAMTFPHCADCVRSKKRHDVSVLSEFLEGNEI